jgi:hypothetical protein
MRNILTINPSTDLSLDLQFLRMRFIDSLSVTSGGVNGIYAVTINKTYKANQEDNYGNFIIDERSNIAYVKDRDSDEHIESFAMMSTLYETVVCATYGYLRWKDRTSQELSAGSQVQDKQTDALSHKAADVYLFCEAAFITLAQARFKLTSDDLSNNPELVPLYTQLATYHNPKTYDAKKLKVTIDELHKYSNVLFKPLHGLVQPPPTHETT